MRLTAAIDKIRPCVVQIALVATNLSQVSKELFKTDGIHKPIGTGFFVNNNAEIITANHVIEGGNKELEKIEAEEKSLKIGIAQPNELPNLEAGYAQRKTIDWRAQFTFTDFDIIGQDKKSDLILLKLKENPFTGELTSGEFVDYQEVPLLYGTAYFPIASRGKPKDGSEIAISGFPLNEPILYTTSGILASTWHFELRKSNYRIIPPDLPEEIKEILSYEIEDIYYGDIHAFPGHSGSPVYFIDDAHIIGVCVAGRLLKVIDKYRKKGEEKPTLQYLSGITQIVPVYLVHRLLIENVTGWAPPMREEYSQR